MKFVNFKTENEASDFVAKEIIEMVGKNSKINLGLATGSTPIPLYQALANDFSINKTNWEKVQTFNLDEYLDLPDNHPQTYRVFMNQHLFSKVNIDLSNTYFPNLQENYDQLINKLGGIDLQILGIGTNGHIGFNEPGSELNSLTRIVDLTEETITTNANKFFDGDTKLVPKQAISMGIDSILKAKKIILLAFGKTKKDVVKTLKNTKQFDINFPASALILHPDVTIITDDEANSF